jgi:ABC-type branched-subunit amino acid transport system substrate-binding protein
MDDDGPFGVGHPRGESGHRKVGCRAPHGHIRADHRLDIPIAGRFRPGVLDDRLHHGSAGRQRGGEVVVCGHPGQNLVDGRLDHTDYGETVDKIMSGGAEVVFNTIVPPGLTPFIQQLHDAGFTKRGGHLVCTYFDENFLNLVPAEQVEGLYSCLDYYQDADDPFSKELLNRYEELYPGSAMFTAGSACSGMYRGLRLWESAVREAGSLDQEDIIRELDHAKIAVGPGGPAEMVPGQHHVRMNMYIGQVRNGTVKIVQSLGIVDPDECMVGEHPFAQA